MLNKPNYDRKPLTTKRVMTFYDIYLPSDALRDTSQSYEVVLYATFAFQVLGTFLFLLAIFARIKQSKRASETSEGQDNFTFSIAE